MKLRFYTGEKDVSIYGDHYRMLDFTDDAQFQPYTLIRCEGLDAVEAAIESTEDENDGGIIVNSTKLEARTIIIDIAINQPFAENRNNLFKYFNINNGNMFLNYIPDSIYSYGRDLTIPVRVKKVQVSAFDNPQKAQITLLAVNPYFKKYNNETSFPIWVPSNTSNKYYVNVLGDCPCGVVFRVYIRSAVTSVTIGIGTEDPEPGKPYLLGNRMFFQSPTSFSGFLNIDTREGKKSVQLDGDERFDLLMLDSTWFKIPPGRFRVELTDSSGTEGNSTITGQCDYSYNGG